MAKVLFVGTRGVDDPTAATLPFHLAVNGAVAAGQQAEIALAGDGAGLIRSENSDRVVGVGIPPLKDLLARAISLGIPIAV
jgi:predicted peroxiredoxin